MTARRDKAALDIRHAAPGDAEAIACLLRDLGYPNSVDSVKCRLITLSRKESDHLLVAEGEAGVLGVAHLQVAELLHEPGRLGRITALVVKHGYRRLGIGRKLMAHLERLAGEAGCTKTELTSSVLRSGAHAFYTNLGYEEKSKRFVKHLG